MNKSNEKYTFSNIELEQILLGSLMNNNNLYDSIDTIININIFFEQTHQILYKFMYERFIAGKIADFYTIVGSCDQLSIDSDYLKSLYLFGEKTTANIVTYAEELVELYKRRKLLSIQNYIQTNLSKISSKQQINYLEQEIFSLTETTTSAKTFSFYEASVNVLKTTEQIIKSPNRQVGIGSPFVDLNKLLGGFKPGELIILAGRPSVGKTAFSANLMSHVCKNNTPTLFISLEMPYEQICMRLLSSLCDLPLSLLTRAQISKQQLHETMDNLDKFKTWPLYIHDTSYLTIGLLGSILRQMKRLYGIQLVIVDYLQLMDSGLRAESREQDISKISRALKLFAKEFNVPIIALSQMSRNIEQRKDGDSPKLSDLRGSGSIEQDADVIIFLYRQQEDNRNLITVSVAKNRNGALGEFQLLYNPEITTFNNYYN